MLEILIVDDGPDTCEYLLDFLQTEGHQGETLQDPTRATEALRTRPFHVVLLDIMMPRLSGMQVLEQIRAVDKEIPIIILTGYPEVDTAIASIHHNVTGYLKKPFSLEDLRGALEKAARKHGLSLDRERALYAEIGRAVRAARKEKQFTLKDLGLRTRLSISLLSQIERGEGNPTVQSLFRIAAALDIRLGDVFRDF